MRMQHARPRGATASGGGEAGLTRRPTSGLRAGSPGMGTSVPEPPAPPLLLAGAGRRHGSYSTALGWAQAPAGH